MCFFICAFHGMFKPSDPYVKFFALSAFVLALSYFIIIRNFILLLLSLRISLVILILFVYQEQIIIIQIFFRGFVAIIKVEIQIKEHNQYIRLWRLIKMHAYLGECIRRECWDIHIPPPPSSPMFVYISTTCGSTRFPNTLNADTQLRLQKWSSIIPEIKRHPVYTTSS